MLGALVAAADVDEPEGVEAVLVGGAAAVVDGAAVVGAAVVGAVVVGAAEVGAGEVGAVVAGALVGGVEAGAAGGADSVPPRSACTSRCSPLRTYG